jgi:uncharacterized membrane protein (UPF0127 family)
MNLPRWTLAGFRKWLTRRHDEQDTRLQIRNLTRQTVLATCLEVADSSAKRNKGLLGRTGLAAGEGLWILPCQSVHTFGMKFSIDLVYLDQKRRIRKIRSNVPPWRVSACLTAHSVIELPSDTVRETQSRPGDELEFSAVSPLESCSRGIASDV